MNTPNDASDSQIAKMCDAHDWDGTPDVAKWHDIYTSDELAAALDLQAAKLAKLHGYYEIAAEITAAADCIRDLAEQLEASRSAGAALARQVMAARESLTSKP